MQRHLYRKSGDGANASVTIERQPKSTLMQLHRLLSRCAGASAHGELRQPWLLVLLSW